MVVPGPGREYNRTSYRVLHVWLRDPCYPVNLGMMTITVKYMAFGARLSDPDHSSNIYMLCYSPFKSWSLISLPISVSWT